ncbi:MAG: polyphosphate polymerase domain-containing protein [Clostridia bacterium]|nr:polyphosphate polymerase domain-containing protein [Clostridia bacterium]
MAERIEEKYLISYPDYSIIANRARSVLSPDENGKNGRYSICSLYFDDVYDTALSDKEDGNSIHIKYRIRTYDGNGDFIRLERKTKRGIVTEKHSAVITPDDLNLIILGKAPDPERTCAGLASEMRAGGQRPAINVRYDREAYCMPSLGIRLTFDMNVESLAPEAAALFGDTRRAVPAVGKDKVIMEIKYSDRCPSFIRKICGNAGMQFSVSKYALCRNAPAFD